MRLVLTIVSAFLFHQLTFCQDYVWSTQFGGTGQDRVFGLVENSNNDIISTSSFQNSVSFGSPSNINSNGSTDIAILSITQHGNFNWVKTFGGTSDDFSRAIDIDVNGNIYFVANYKNTVDFDPNSTIFNLTSQGNHDIAIIKLDPLGNLIWAKSIGGSGLDDALDIEVSTIGEIVITGKFSGTCDFDPSSNTQNRTASGFQDVFLAKYDNNGNFMWANTFGSTISGIEAGYQIEILSNGNVACIGSFLGTVDIDPSNSIVNLTSTSGEDAFLCLYTSAGSLIWGKSWGGSGEDVAAGIKVGTNGDFYIGGFFRNTTDLNPGTATANFNSPGSRSCFTMKLDAAGNYVWGNITATISAETNFKLQIDRNDNIYLSGYFFYTMDFDPGPSTYTIINAGAGDGYVQKLDQNGNFIWAYPIGGSGTDQSTALLLGKNDHVYSAGLFSSTVDFDPGTSIANQTAVGNFDSYIQKIWDCSQTDSSIFAIACNSYNSPSGKYVWTANGNYQDTILNSSGCDSILTINLFITNQNTAVIQNGFTLSNNASNSTFQWLDCGNNYAIIPTETSSQFTAIQNGSYAVEVTENGCKDTSICTTIIGVGINNQTVTAQSLTIAPNPSNEAFYLTWVQPFSGNIRIFSNTGQLVYEKNISSQIDLKIDIYLSKGVYSIRTTNLLGKLNVSKLILD